MPMSVPKMYKQGQNNCLGTKKTYFAISKRSWTIELIFRKVRHICNIASFPKDPAKHEVNNNSKNPKVDLKHKFIIHDKVGIQNNHHWPKKLTSWTKLFGSGTSKTIPMNEYLQDRETECIYVQFQETPLIMGNKHSTFLQIHVSFFIVWIWLILTGTSAGQTSCIKLWWLIWNGCCNCNSTDN